MRAKSWTDNAGESLKASPDQESQSHYGWKRIPRSSIQPFSEYPHIHSPTRQSALSAPFLNNSRDGDSTPACPRASSLCRGRIFPDVQLEPPPGCFPEELGESLFLHQQICGTKALLQERGRRRNVFLGFVAGCLKAEQNLIRAGL